MDHLVSLHVFTVCLVPCVVWPLLGSCLCQEFSMMSSMLYGALYILQCLLICPPLSPRTGKKKHLVISSVITERLNQWTSSSGMMNLWQDACAGVMLLFLRKLWLKIMFNGHLMVIMEMFSKPWVLLVLRCIITLLPARNLYNTILRTQSLFLL